MSVKNFIDNMTFKSKDNIEFSENDDSVLSFKQTININLKSIDGYKNSFDDKKLLQFFKFDTIDLCECCLREICDFAKETDFQFFTINKNTACFKFPTTAVKKNAKRLDYYVGRITFAKLNIEALLQDNIISDATDLKGLNKATVLSNPQYLIPAGSNDFYLIFRNLLLNNRSYSYQALNAELEDYKLYKERARIVELDEFLQDYPSSAHVKATNTYNYRISNLKQLNEFKQLLTNSRDRFISLFYSKMITSEKYAVSHIDHEGKSVLSLFIVEMMDNHPFFQPLKNALKHNLKTYWKLLDVVVMGLLAQSLKGDNLLTSLEKFYRVTPHKFNSEIYRHLAKELSKELNVPVPMICRRVLGLLYEGRQLAKGPAKTLAIDGVGLASSSKISYSSTGYSSNGLQEQCKSIIIFDPDEGLPVYAELVDGNTHDVIPGKKIFARFENINAESSIFIADKGFDGLQSYASLLFSGQDFVIMSKLTNNLKKLLLEVNIDLSLECFMHFSSDAFNNDNYTACTIELEAHELGVKEYKDALNSNLNCTIAPEQKLYATFFRPVDKGYIEKKELLERLIVACNGKSDYEKLDDHEKALLRPVSEESKKDDCKIETVNISSNKKLHFRRLNNNYLVGKYYEVDLEELMNQTIFTNTQVLVSSFATDTPQEIVRLYKLRPTIEVVNKKIQSGLEQDSMRSHSDDPAQIRLLVSLMIYFLEFTIVRMLPYKPSDKKNKIKTFKQFVSIGKKFTLAIMFSEHKFHGILEHNINVAKEELIKLFYPNEKLGSKSAINRKRDEIVTKYLSVYNNK